MAEKGYAICCSILLIAIASILSAILVGTSIKNVDFHQAGLLLNTVTKKIEQGKVYLPGK